MTKVCSPTKGCGIEKDINEFYKENNIYKYICKICLKQYRQQYYEKNKQKEIKQRKQYRKNNYEKEMLYASKRRAIKRGLEHNLTIEDIQIPEVCPILGIKLEPDTCRKTGSHCSPSLDRIDSNKGYIKGNVRIISFRANLLKSNATLKELEMILEDAKMINKMVGNEES